MAIATVSFRFARVFAVAASVWLAALLVAPLAASAPRGTTRFATAGAVYLAGRLVCHQQASRSFHLAGTQLPVCARCTGLYVGAVAGALVACGRRRRLAAPIARRALAIAAVPTALTVAAAWTGWWEATNVTRALAALPLGAAIAWSTAAALDRGLE